MNSWAMEELQSSNLGDKRLDERFCNILERVAEDPGSSLSGAMKGWSEVMGATRFFKNKRVTMEKVLRPHRASALERVRTQKRVLVVQDTTELDYTSKKKLIGKGPLNFSERQGFFMHTQWLVGDHNLPLGVWHSRIHFRTTLGMSNRTRKKVGIHRKESRRWLEGYAKACRLAKAAPEVEVISVSDREGDIYEVFERRDNRLRKGKAAPHWVIRCCQKHRALLEADGRETNLHLKEEAERAPVVGTITLEVKRKEWLKRVNGKKKGKKTSIKTVREARTLTQEIRICKLLLKPPFRRGGRKEPVAIWAVSAKEIDPPEGEEPVHWLILTSMPVENFADAMKVLGIYKDRWEVEVFHRVFKSGCRVEGLQLKNRSSLKPALALYMIVAWRILYLSRLGRSHPELPCDVAFAEAEWKAMMAVAGKRPGAKPTLGLMVELVARLGGYLGRKRDGPPGPQVMWKGMRKLQNYAEAWKAFGSG